MSDVNEFNVETGEFIIRPYTEEELFEMQRIANLTTDIPITIDSAVNESLVSAITKLKSLGLTEEEAKAIAGL